MPDECVATPHTASRSGSDNTAFSAPRILNAPPRWKFSHLNTTFAPQLSETPGGTEWAGPPLGAHNDEVYGTLLGLDAATRAPLARDGII